jgi:hypothetical protein
LRVAKGGGVGIRVGGVVDRAVDADLAPALVEGAGGLRRGQGAGQPLEEQPDGSNAQALPRLAQAGAVGIPVVGHEPARGLEDGSDGQLGEDAHGQHQPAGDLEGQGAAAAVEAAGVFEDLQDVGGGDNLLQQEQLVEDAVALADRQGAFPVFRSADAPLLAAATHRGLPGG